MRQPHPDSLPTPPGWKRRHTGGGCWAFERELDGLDITITDPYGATLPTTDDVELLVGFQLHDEALHFEEGNPPEIPQLSQLAPVFAPFDVNGDYFSVLIPKPDLGDGSGGWPHVFQILNTISRDSLKYEIVLREKQPEEEK